MAINQDCCDLVGESFGQFCSKKVCISTMNTVLSSTCLTVHKRLPWLQINLYSNFRMNGSQEFLIDSCLVTIYIYNIGICAFYNKSTGSL